MACLYVTKLKEDLDRFDAELQAEGDATKRIMLWVGFRRWLETVVRTAEAQENECIQEVLEHERLKT